MPRPAPLRRFAGPLASLAAIALVLVSRAGAGDAVDEAIVRIERARAGVRTIVAAFEQQRVMGLFSQTVRASGELQIVRPDRLRWSVASPAASVFVVNGTRMSFRSSASAGAASTAQLGSLGLVLGDLAAFLGGSLHTLRSRYSMLASTAEGRLVVTASPRSVELRRAVERVVLSFGSDLRTIERLELHEPGGDHSVITLSNVRVNVAVSRDAFQP